jgi:hypothetical protein
MTGIKHAATKMRVRKQIFSELDGTRSEKYYSCYSLEPSMCPNGFFNKVKVSKHKPLPDG